MSIMLTKNFFIVVFILTFKLSLCEEDEGCQLKKSTKKLDDILLQIRNRGLYGQIFSVKTSGSEFEFKVCYDVKKDRPKLQNATITRRGLSEGTIEVIGFRNDTTVFGDGEWTLMSFNGATCSKGVYSSAVMMKCDLQTKGDFSLMYEDKENCQFMFELRTSEMCTEGTHMSGWSIFFIIILVSFLVYAIVGVLYLRYRIGAKGVEQIPHRQFWFKVGNAFADCFGFVCRCDKCFDTHSGDLHSPYSDYSPIVGGSSYPSGIRDDPPIQP